MVTLIESTDRNREEQLQFLLTQADKWLLLKEFSSTSRYEQVECLRHNIYHELINKHGVSKLELAKLNRTCLDENKYFLRHWTIASRAASWLKTDQTRKLDQAFADHANVTPHSEAADRKLMSAMDEWLEAKKDSNSSRYGLVVTMREHLEEMIGQAVVLQAKEHRGLLEEQLEVAEERLLKLSPLGGVLDYASSLRTLDTVIDELDLPSDFKTKLDLRIKLNDKITETKGHYLEAQANLQLMNFLKKEIERNNQAGILSESLSFSKNSQKLIQEIKALKGNLSVAILTNISDLSPEFLATFFDREQLRNISFKDLTPAKIDSLQNAELKNELNAFYSELSQKKQTWNELFWSFLPSYAKDPAENQFDLLIEKANTQFNKSLSTEIDKKIMLLITELTQNHKNLLNKIRQHVTEIKKLVTSLDDFQSKLTNDQSMSQLKTEDKTAQKSMHQLCATLLDQFLALNNELEAKIKLLRTELIENTNGLKQYLRSRQAEIDAQISEIKGNIKKIDDIIDAEGKEISSEFAQQSQMQLKM